MKLVITGSKGLIGSYTVNYANGQKGVAVLGVDVVGMGNRTNYLVADLTDFGQTIDALEGADAVVHLAAIPSQRYVTAAKTFVTNVGSTWNVLSACAKLGIRRVVAASSVQVSRSVTMRTPIHYPYFPLDESHADPQDDYSMSKYVGERLGDLFSKHYGLTIASLRFTMVLPPEELKNYPQDHLAKDHLALYTYVDVRDVARACYLAATQPLAERSHTVAFIVAKDSYVNIPSREVVKRAFPHVKIRTGLKGYDALISGKTAQRAFGFEPEFSCRSNRATEKRG